LPDIHAALAERKPQKQRRPSKRATGVALGLVRDALSGAGERRQYIDQTGIRLKRSPVLLKKEF
jgi:hypothetical protein